MSSFQNVQFQNIRFRDVWFENVFTGKYYKTSVVNKIQYFIYENEILKYAFNRP